MSTQEQALADLASLLDRLRIPYMIIGGLANAVWGEPRATVDIDVSLWVAEAEIRSTIAHLTAHLPALVAEPAEFVARTRVLPVADSRGVRIDIVFGMLPFEEQAIRRAVTIPVAGAPVRFCTAEDLILHKVVSDREQDLADVRGILRRQLPRLDLAYLEPRIAELARLLDRPEIQSSFSAWKREASGPGRAEPDGRAS